MRTIIIAAALLASATQLWAGGPDNWQMGFSEPASETEARIIALHDHLMLIGVGIVLLVVALLAVAIFRFRASRHPVPSTLTRLPWLEFGWTVAPVAVLGAIAVPSMQLLAYESRIPEADITVKVSAHQWFWRYSYPDNGGFTVDSTMTPPSQVAAGEPRLLSVDNRMVVPVGAVVRIQVTSSDVVHSFFMPALGMQIYAVPGRLNETWTKIDRPGVYYGQCNQICGLDHSFMPIGIEAKPQAEFDAWIADAKTRFPTVDSGAFRTAMQGTGEAR
jgi:cytochrome c oxidase subunit 2